MITNNKIGVHLIVHGKVQGVFFRDFTNKTAHKLAIAGWVKNLSDGTVEACGYGTKSNIEFFVKELSAGPSAARVDNIDIEPIDFDSEYSSFKIIY